MKIISVSIILIISLSFYARAYSYVDRAIEDPNIIKVCDDLTDKRKLKIEHIKKLQGVLSKNIQMQRKLRKSQEKVRLKLQRLYDKIVFEIKVASGRVVDFEEQIIKSGCPPIELKGQTLRTSSTQEIVNSVDKDLNIEELDLVNIEDAPSSPEQ